MTTHIAFRSIANRMRKRALGGEFRAEGTFAERTYVDRCAQRVGRTTLVFTRDADQHTAGWLTDPRHERCCHLSMRCIDDAERDAWLRAFFGEHVDKIWVQSATSS